MGGIFYFRATVAACTAVILAGCGDQIRTNYPEKPQHDATAQVAGAMVTLGSPASAVAGVLVAREGTAFVAIPISALRSVVAPELNALWNEGPRNAETSARDSRKSRLRASYQDMLRHAAAVAFPPLKQANGTPLVPTGKIFVSNARDIAFVEVEPVAGALPIATRIPENAAVVLAGFTESRKQIDTAPATLGSVGPASVALSSAAARFGSGAVVLRESGNAVALIARDARPLERSGMELAMGFARGERDWPRVSGAHSDAPRIDNVDDLAASDWPSLNRQFVAAKAAEERILNTAQAALVPLAHRFHRDTTQASLDVPPDWDSAVGIAANTFKRDLDARFDGTALWTRYERYLRDLDALGSQADALVRSSITNPWLRDDVLEDLRLLRAQVSSAIEECSADWKRLNLR